MHILNERALVAYMKFYICRGFLLMLIVILLLGCGSAKQYRGGQYERVPEHRVQEDLESLKRQGGIFIQRGQGHEAVEVLERANRMASSDAEVIINLGVAYMLTEDYGKAVTLWKEFVLKNPDHKATARMKKYLTLLLYKEASQLAKEAVNNERLFSSQAVSDSNTLAVSYFGERGLSSDVKPLQKALAAMLITDLSKADGVRVVERIKMHRLIEELKLSGSGLIDPNTAPRLGRLLGAGKIVCGNIGGLDDKNIDIVGILSNVTPVRNIANQQVQGNSDEFFRLEKELAAQIVQDLKGTPQKRISTSSADVSGQHQESTPTKKKKKAKKQKRLSTPEQTSSERASYQERSAIFLEPVSFESLKTYGAGLDAQDMGNWDQAIRLFETCNRLYRNAAFRYALDTAPSSADAALSPIQIAADLKRYYTAAPPQNPPTNTGQYKMGKCSCRYKVGDTPPTSCSDNRCGPVEYEK